jgi:hypothetical protein
MSVVIKLGPFLHYIISLVLLSVTLDSAAGGSRIPTQPNDVTAILWKRFGIVDSDR